MASEDFEQSNLTVDVVRRQFWCLASEHAERCTGFINNSSAEWESMFGGEENGTRPLNKKIKVSKDPSTDVAGSSGCCKPHIEQLMSLLSAHLNELNENIENSEQELTTNATAITVINSGFFNILYAIQHDLVKLRRCLTIKPIKRSLKSNQKMTGGGENGFRNNETDSYNQNIDSILNNRLLVLQLVHFECIILRYFSQAEHLLQANVVPVFSHDLVQAKLQPIFRLYYSLMIKLTYEVPFLKLIILIHHKSFDNSVRILFLLFRLVSAKVSPENGSADLAAIMESLLTPASNNRMIVTLLDYIYTLAKIDQFVEKCHPVEGFTFPPLDSLQRYNCHYENGFRRLIPANAATLVDVCYSILAYFASCQDFYSPKSTVRCRTIEILVHITHHESGITDALRCGSLLIQTTLNLLAKYLEYHRKICASDLLNLGRQKSPPAKKSKQIVENELNLKHYRFVLRDIYGLLSLLLTFTENFPLREVMCQVDVQHRLFEQFLLPFVHCLEGEHCSDAKPEGNNPYGLLRSYNQHFKHYWKCVGRIVSFSSIVIQRLLNPLVLPIADCRNPFSFKLPTEVECNDNENVASDLEDGQFLLNFDSDIEDCEDTEEDTEDDLTGSSASIKIDSTTGYSEEKSSSSYLAFFPEIQEFNWDTRFGTEQVLSCLGTDEPNRILSPLDKMDFSQLLNSEADSNFSWSEIYQTECHSTNTVIPKVTIPEPEVNFVNHSSAQPPPPLSSPFTENVIRRKSFHHFRLLEHIRERFVPEVKYKVVYDIELSEQPVLDQCLKFESRFECGNLRKALVNVDSLSTLAHEYILILNTDVNAASHTQWYYYSVTEMRTDITYRFKMINCEKKSLLYNCGQQPLVYSSVDFLQKGLMWQRSGEQGVAYYRNHYVRNGSMSSVFKDKHYYTLEFEFKFPNKEDHCYFAYNIPFSYTFLKTNIAYWKHLVEQYSSEEIFFSPQTLGHGLNGNPLPLLTITSKLHSTLPRKPHYILLTARVHPAESNSSWMLKGLVDYLLHPLRNESDELIRKHLLESYVFKIIPMLNPEGVINGCTRTDLQTQDLNRHWHDPSPLLHPTIHRSKELLKCLHKYSSGQSPVAYLDLHGHSRLHNIFSYGCLPQLSWKKSDRQQYIRQCLLNHTCVCALKKADTSCQLKSSLKRLNNCRLMPPTLAFPVLLHLQRAPVFEIENCSFAIQRDRENTGRVVCWREFNIPLAYTIECSAAGCDSGPHSGSHLDTQLMEEMGKYLASSFAFITFVHCCQRHCPVVVMPTLTTTTTDHSYLEILLAKCIRGTKPSQALTLRQRRQKQKLLQMYPDLNLLSSCKEEP